MKIKWEDKFPFLAAQMQFIQRILKVICNKNGWCLSMTNNFLKFSIIILQEIRKSKKNKTNKWDKSSGTCDIITSRFFIDTFSCLKTVFFATILERKIRTEDTWE